MSLDVTKELSQNFIEYAVAVNSDRAIPDSTSGLKPVARRILFGAFDTGRFSTKPYVKNARIVGDVMGSLHPHGDSSIYGALVRLSQPWVMRYPLIDFHGNQGSINGDGPAAMRYTEGRLAKLAEDGLLNGLKKNCVDMMSTYDDSSEEPITLPAIFPNLLCNPNSGIGVALACSWACHNLREVRDAIIAFMDGKTPTLPGPDFPTGGIIINKNDIPAIMQTGHGSVKIRAKYEIVKKNIVITEIPYGTTVEDLCAEIGKFADDNPDLGIVEISDQTNSKGVKIVIECNTESNAVSNIQKLFAKTNLQTTFSYNQVALVNGTPTELNLKDCCDIYVKHNVKCLRREIEFDLNKAKERLHIVEGLLIALEDIDNVIALIKKADSASDAKVKLMDKYGISDIQAKAILDMKLSRLAKLEKIELENEKKDLLNAIAEYETLLSSEDKLKEVIKTRLNTLVDKYGDDRRTVLDQITITKEEKEIVAVIPEDVVVVTTQSGLVKKIPVSSFKAQKRGGKGIKSNDDVVLDVIKTNTVDLMCFFSTKGKMYRTLVDNIPTGTNVAKGTPINSLVKAETGESIIAVSSLHRTSVPKFIIFITKKGVIKKGLLEDYIGGVKKAGGSSVIKLTEGDEVVNVLFQDEEEVVIATKNGIGIRFGTKDITPTGKTAMGVKGIKLNDGDEVVSALSLHKTTDTLGIFHADGTGKKIALSELPSQGRAGKGTIITKGGEVVGTAMISDEDNILLVGGSNAICINATDIPLLSKVAIGNKLAKFGIKSITKI